MPAATWLGHTDRPGETTATGPIDAGTCRDLAGRLAASPATTWCLTLTDPDGHAVAHGCAKTRPGAAHAGRQPPATGPPGDPRPAWLASIKITWLEQGHCTHPRQVKPYRPGSTLRHLIAIRHRTCGFPGCTRPAQRCDADHTIPYDQGGITCECNLGPTSK